MPPRTEPHPPSAPFNPTDADPVAGRLRRRLAALGIVGALMVALPLVQVLRYQNDELDTLASQRAGLDPVARAVDVQRGLLSHRDVAAAVLHGDPHREPERRVQQRDVDHRVGVLGSTLDGGRWQHAAREASALRDDWSLLASGLTDQAVGAAESEQAHRLLVEQVLQIVDLLADSLAPLAARLEQVPAARATTGGDHDAGALRAARALPRLMARMAGASASARELSAAEADLARLLGALNAGSGRYDATGHRLLTTAGAAAGAAADRYFSLLRQGAPRMETQAAAAVALSMQFRLFDLALATVDTYLSVQSAAAAQRRLAWVAAAGAGGLLALALGLQVGKGLGRRDRRSPAGRRAPGLRAELLTVGQLLQRLRDGVGSGQPAADLGVTPPSVGIAITPTAAADSSTADGSGGGNRSPAANGQRQSKVGEPMPPPDA